MKLNASYFLEQILEKISISENREKHIRNIVGSINKKLKTIDSKYKNYRFGGSFKRYTNIKNYFDVDVYFVGDYPRNNLLNYFNNKLRKLQSSYKPFKIARKPPYLHAIPAIFNNDVELDCLPAIKLNDIDYLIPEGNRTIKMSPKTDEIKLEELNKKTKGNGTKIIRLLKKWNSIYGKPFKSYQIEVLIYDFFKNKYFPKLNRYIEIFFNRTADILKRNYYRFNPFGDYSILKNINMEKTINLIGQTLYLISKNQWTKVCQTI
jgi:tRNA nucleotidyltransferase (CCA-adding enzyme)